MFKVVKGNVIPESRVVIIRDPIFDHIPTLNSLLSLGESSKEAFEERRLSKGEARKALAFLSLSSGTTGIYFLGSPTTLLIHCSSEGPPKVTIIPPSHTIQD